VLSGDSIDEGVLTMETVGHADAVAEVDSVDVVSAEAVRAAGDSVVPPVAVAAATDCVGHTVWGNTLEVSVPVDEGEALKSALSLAASEGSEDSEATAAVPVGAPVGAPLPLSSRLEEGDAAALEVVLGGCDAVAVPLSEPLSLL
jgi:hypothetical protein